MNNLRNRVQLIGHLGADPEIRTLENGKLARIRMATNENYKTQSGEWKEVTTWHTIVVWNTLAERAAQHLYKGAYIALEGRLVNREYTTQQNEKRYITEIQASSFMILDKKQPNTPDTDREVQDTIDDGLPF